MSRILPVVRVPSIIAMPFLKFVRMVRSDRIRPPLAIVRLKSN
jgi:hypothetical protein